MLLELLKEEKILEQREHLVLDNPLLPKFELTQFTSIDDTILFYKGVEKATKGFQYTPKVFDLGFGSCIMGLTLLKKGLISEISGIDIDPQAIEKANLNAEICGIDKSKLSLVQGNIDELKESINTHTDILTANLPYLPVPKNKEMHISVSAGEDGTNYVPNTILEYAKTLTPKKIVFNFCSMSSPIKILEIIQQSSYNISDCTILICPFGRYTKQLIEYYEKKPEFIFHQDGNEFWQCIISLEIDGRAKIAPLELMKDLYDFKLTGTINNPQIETFKSTKLEIASMYNRRQISNC